MTIAELTQVIGKRGLLDTNGLQVAVTIQDIKQAYGRTRFVVSPIDGHGTVTVESFRVKFEG